MANNTKREAWNALNEYCPEFVPIVREIADIFGIDEVEVETDNQHWIWEKKN